MHVEGESHKSSSNENCREELVCLKYSEGLVIVSNRSSSVRVEGRARQ